MIINKIEYFGQVGNIEKYCFKDNFTGSASINYEIIDMDSYR